MDHLGHILHQKSQPLNVLVFGGSGIIGRAIALKFAQQGWSVGVHYHQNRSLAEEIVGIITTAGGDARHYQADVGDLLQMEKVFLSFVQDHGSLNLLVWAVGVAPSKLLTKTTPEEWVQTLETNLTGAFHVLREAGPIFERQLDGAVIIVGSLSGEQGMTGQGAYAASKAGLIGLMRTTAQEWAGWNIRINVIFPGWHASPLSASGMGSALTLHTHLLNRTPSLNHMASSVYHLATTQDISGQIWNLDSRIW